MTDTDADRPADDAESTVFHVARTPAEANLVRALLEGAGIPANVEGGMLADEFAVSQRLMNVQGVRVFVREDQVERARRVLAEARVSDAELEQQAMAAAGDPEAERPLPRPTYPVEDRPSPSKVPIVLAGVFAVLTVVFFGLWMEERSGGNFEDPLYLYGVHDHGPLTLWRHNGAEAFRLIDRDGDRVFEESRYFDRAGELLSVSYDPNGDGLPDRLVEHREDGLRYEWLDDDGDGRWDRCRILDAAGEVRRELRYGGAAGFLEVERR